MGTIIVITGAGVGLGRALARRFAADGETVVLLGRTFSKVQMLAEELGPPAFAVACDVSSADSVRAAFTAIAERHSKIDVLINNAAMYEPFLVAKGTDEQILGHILTNFAGPIFTTRAAIPLMSRGGQIINVSSEVVALEFRMFSLYQSTKAALERFTLSLFRELEADGIRVSTVRAGQMSDEGEAGSVQNWDPAVRDEFFKVCLAAGLDLRARGLSRVTAVTDVFRTLLNLPADVSLPHVSIEARHP